MIIRGYQTQWRPYGDSTWRVLYQTDNPNMAGSLDSMANCMRKHGDGFFRIIKLFKDGSTAVRFFAAFGDSAESDYRDK